MYPVNHPLNYSQPFCLINMCLVRFVCEKNNRLNSDIVITLSKNHAFGGSVLPYSFQSWFPGGQTHLSLSQIRARSFRALQSPGEPAQVH